MATSQKSVLILGFKHAGAKAPFGDEQLWKMIDGEVERLTEAGYYAEQGLIEDAATYDLNDLRKLVRSRPWTVVTVGFGVRGPPQYTPLFEQLINTVVEESETTPKFAFQSMPDNIFEAVERVLGKA